MPARPGRSRRLADLADATGARGYLCGTGGMKYLESDLFTARDIAVIPFRTPANGLWQSGRTISAVHSLMCLGPKALAEQLRTVATSQGGLQPACLRGTEHSPLLDRGGGSTRQRTQSRTTRRTMTVGQVFSRRIISRRLMRAAARSSSVSSSFAANSAFSRLSASRSAASSWFWRVSSSMRATRSPAAPRDTLPTCWPCGHARWPAHGRGRQRPRDSRRSTRCTGRRWGS
ncbi:hypothetical protein [Streptomyces sp. RPT161]|uniref:hypothetical protein n=1 Tax=Streptomyces sp. RPT161 TaxID=3015993 RepID=UPI002FCEE644